MSQPASTMMTGLIGAKIKKAGWTPSFCGWWMQENRSVRSLVRGLTFAAGSNVVIS